MRFSMVFLVIAVAFMLVASASAGPLVTNGLSLYYSFDSVGTTVSDGSGNGYDGSVVGNVVQAASGVVGGAAQFWTEGVDIPDYFVPDNPENADYNYINLPVSAMGTSGDIPTSGFTVALWYNTKAYLDDVEGKESRHWSNQSILGPVSSDATWVFHGELRSRDNETDDFLSFRCPRRLFGRNWRTQSRRGHRRRAQLGRMDASFHDLRQGFFEHEDI